ncbi:dTDP-glucose 4,6-dehydratase [Clostridium felsineum]|uniref:UDP-glucose 4-epimerase n=1 Tax=Clostridium felsineum TaxID=36839 RepID=A0A1S8MDE5_9CLOT|nr:SDR family NAD(P)-dependent oxidoreductase [Clostridium felsineum]MCR3757819.1 SDR family NAD(P)-dependent oxidoreductase [Clostridium felsineum]URZ00927.1 UDP-glucose 4-epimerase [Clostridium felsineum]URZ06327.1 UDP-glucose 4-epimerase [Clostridium felsineum]URZ11362.1 UDP-glucose 4-epimerase [Clostridium felsineum]URZ16023.1 UDP-glucose 4-epimerase [Clostridium felsineum DSM 794]
MNILVTGGAGFIGRWVVKKLLEDGNSVTALDNLSNGSLENINEFKDEKFRFIEGDIKSKNDLDKVFEEKYDIIYHLAASIVVQESIDEPEKTFFNDTVGTFNILERAKKQMFGENGKMNGSTWEIDENDDIHPCKVVFMSTCMVYDISGEEGIDENHNVKPVSPYGGSKIAAENMVLSYFNAYKLPVVVIRPFNTYGPFQKSNGEGGVVSIFLKNFIDNKPINIYGSGNQTRDLLFVKDCADFVVTSGYKSKVDGQIINAGTGNDITINDLAKLIAGNKVPVNHVEHIHPQSEIMKLKCNYLKAKKLMGWNPHYTLEEGIAETKAWLALRVK